MTRCAAWVEFQTVKRFSSRLILGNDPARFQRGRGQSWHHIPLANHLVGLRERGLHISCTLADAHGHVRAEGLMNDCRLALDGRIGIEDWR